MNTERADVGIITGTGLYDLELEDALRLHVETPFGPAAIMIGQLSGKRCCFIARHKVGHKLLPHQINYRANLWAMKELGIRALLTTSVMGLLKPNMNLGIPLVIEDIFFIDNRLPSGEVCTIFSQHTEKKGHFIFQKPISPALQKTLVNVLQKMEMKYYRANYHQCYGPRFNTRMEIKWLQQVGVSAISQTGAVEVFLAGELQIPCQLIGFGVDYANGVGVTPKDKLTANISASRSILETVISSTVKAINLDEIFFDTGYNYWL